MKCRKNTLWLSLADDAMDAQDPALLAQWLIQQLGEPVRAMPFIDPHELHVETEHQCIPIELFRGDAEEGRYLCELRPVERLQFALALMAAHFHERGKHPMPFEAVPCVHPSICRTHAPTANERPAKQALIWTLGILGLQILGHAEHRTQTLLK